MSENTNQPTKSMQVRTERGSLWRKGLLPTMSPSCCSRRAFVLLLVGLSASLLVGGALVWLVFKEPPAVPAPSVVVVTYYPGMSAQAIEKSITNRIERWVNQVPKISQVESKSIGGVSIVRVHFNPGSDPTEALTRTSELALGTLPTLPLHTLPPVVLPWSDAPPLGILTVSNGQLDMGQVKDAARTVRELLASVHGCVVPRVEGGKEHTTLISLDQKRLAANSLSPLEVVEALCQDERIHTPIPASFDNGRVLLDAEFEVDDLARLNDCSIRIKPNDSVFLRDIGQARNSYSRQTSQVRRNGRRVVLLSVYCQSGARSRSVAQATQKALPGFKKRLPTGTNLDYLPAVDPGLITISLRAPSGLRLQATEKRVAEVERFLEEAIPEAERRALVAELGCTQDCFSAWSANSGEQDATIHLWLSPGRKENPQQTIARLRAGFAGKAEFADLQARFWTGGLDATAWYGSPTAINIQVSGGEPEQADRLSQEVRRRVSSVKDAADVQVAQRLDGPELRIAVDHQKAGEAGLSAREVFVQAAAALNATIPIGHELRLDPKSRNHYVLTVPYPENPGRTLEDALNVVVPGAGTRDPIRLGSLVRLQRTTAPVEINHVSLFRVVNVLVNHATGGDVRRLAEDVEARILDLAIPEGMQVEVQTPGLARRKKGATPE